MSRFACRLRAPHSHRNDARVIDGLLLGADARISFHAIFAFSRWRQVPPWTKTFAMDRYEHASRQARSTHRPLSRRAYLRHTTASANALRTNFPVGIRCWLRRHKAPQQGGLHYATFSLRKRGATRVIAAITRVSPDTEGRLGVDLRHADIWVIDKGRGAGKGLPRR